MRALLDVNVLIALLDGNHIHHKAAMAWLHSHIDHGWASCPLTQNGCIRIMSQPTYPNARSPAEIAARLREATQTPVHEFWPDDLSLLDTTMFNWHELFHPRQITDAYLLALATRHDAAFATFDHAVPMNAVRGAETKHLITL